MKKQVIKRIVICALIALCTFLIAYTQLAYSFDGIFSDRLYQSGLSPNSKIKIIAIDERTVAAYGDVATWSRDIPADLVQKLNGDGTHAPAVIGFDVMYVTQKDAEADARFARVCREGGNVVSAVNLVYRDQLSVQDGVTSAERDVVSMVEYPYDALKDAAAYGFANTYQDRDGYIRYAKWSEQYGEEQICSFSALVYQKYQQSLGEPVVQPDAKNGFFSFSYTGKGGSFEVISMCDVLDGKIDARVFDGAVVLVGAYAPGMQDAYAAPIDRGGRMYGVEIHANIINALLTEKTGVPVSMPVYAGAVTLLVLVFWLLVERMRIVPATLTAIGFVGFDLLASKLLDVAGYRVRIIEPILAIVLLYAIKLIVGYVGESLKKRKILNAFRKYVAPEVVQEIAKSGDYQMTLGGERRHIAVLFVDIRGFTPMSEGLQPEQVVEILNEYLSLTTNAIFKNRGTLDKFIGDATMAVFNAPFDQEDYVYRAVQTALDIAAGSAELEQRLNQRFGKSVSFGIGVHCGDAVVGNIGCEHRMDYTAIGDTVNTAARLESNAGRGQILISRAVVEQLGDRIDADEIGVIPLKGKSNDVLVYQLNGLKKGGL